MYGDDQILGCGDERERRISSPRAIRAIRGLVWPLALTVLRRAEGDTMKTTVNDISNITFIEL